jgi:rSAM/selenodomain-associated transferase 2
VSSIKDLKLAAQNPLLSIIIPAYHEAAIVNGAIAQLGAAATGVPAEIIIADGGGSVTVDALDPATVSQLPENLSLRGLLCKQSGRAAQMNEAARLARSDALLFLHMDTTPGPRTCRMALDCLKKSEAGAFALAIDGKKTAYRLIEKVAAVRNRLTRIPYGDQAIFMQKRIFDEAGGYADLPIMEDIELMRRLKKAGYRIQLLKEPVITSARRWEKEGVLKTTLRNWLLAGLFLAGFPAARLAASYPPSGKYFRPEQ